MKRFLLLSAATIILIFYAVPVFAGDSKDAVIDPERKGNIYIDYKEDLEGNYGIGGAHFKAYKIAELTLEGGYRSILDGDEEINEMSDPEMLLEPVKKYYSERSASGAEYETVTDIKGRAVFKMIDLGLYLIEETEPAPDHLSSSPFIISVPFMQGGIWEYSAAAEPKAQPLGSLEISKKVRGANADPEREFHFKVEFESFNDPVRWEKNDGSAGKIRSGDYVILKSGESITIEGIPEGTVYRVSEKEADSDGYTTTSEGSSGNIKRTIKTKAAFVNASDVPDNGDSYLAYAAGGVAVISFAAAVILAACSGKGGKLKNG